MNHRSSTPRSGTQPTLSVLRRSVGTSTSSAFRVFASLTYAVSLPAIRFRSVAPASFGRRFRNLASVRHTPPAPALWGGLPRLCNLPTAHPHVSKYEKKGGVAASLRGYQIPTLPVRLPRFRVWKIPTRVQLPSPANRRSEPTEYGRLHLAQRHHHAGEPEFPWASGHRRE